MWCLHSGVILGRPHARLLIASLSSACPWPQVHHVNEDIVSEADPPAPTFWSLLMKPSQQRPQAWYTFSKSQIIGLWLQVYAIFNITILYRIFIQRSNNRQVLFYFVNHYAYWGNTEKWTITIISNSPKTWRRNVFNLVYENGDAKVR